MADKTWQEKLIQKERFWQAHIKAWKKSGLSQNAYSRRNKLSSSQFGYWKKKINRQTRPVNFFPVSIQSQKIQSEFANNKSGLTIFLKNGIRIELSNDFTATTLVKVVDALGDQHESSRSC